MQLNDKNLFQVYDSINLKSFFPLNCMRKNLSSSQSYKIPFVLNIIMGHFALDSADEIHPDKNNHDT